MFLKMEEVKKTDDIQEDVAEEVVADTAESGDSSTETEVQDTSSEDVSEENTSTDEVEEKSSEPEAEEDKSSLKEDSEETVPFNKNPKFQERVQEIETKYGKKAQLWDTIAKLSNSDPEFQLELTGRLEAAGELPRGTYELAKKRIETQGVETKEKKEPDGLEEKVSRLPEVQFARDLMRQKQEEEAVEAARIEGILQNFESRHTDIANSEKPQVIRQRIATLAEGYVEEGMKYEDALDEAYTILFDKDGLLAKEREKGEVEGQIKAGIKSVAGASSGSQKPSTQPLRKLTREEEEARAILGFTKEEYIRYKDSDGSVE